MIYSVLIPTFLAAILLSICTPFLGVNQNIDIQQIELPNGFRIEVYADSIENARQLALGENGTVFVGSRKGKVHAIVDTNNDNKGDKVYRIAEDLFQPNGVAFRNGNLYVGEIPRIIRFNNIEKQLKNPPEPIVVYNEYPSKEHHGWKHIAFGPDDKLYVPVGVPCNVCNEEDPVFGTITRMDPDGTNFEIYAEGVRNSVGFDWHPETKELWFTDNGRDWLGNDLPPDELNHAPKKGMHFGFPFCHGTDFSDPKFGEERDCDEFTPAAQELGPHVASLGMIFYTGDQFPAEYKNQILIAEHGSWNRDTPIGYRISMVRLENGETKSYETFAEGWLQGNSAWGRPVDLLQMPDGSILISDDHANAIYRISYSN